MRPALLELEDLEPQKSLPPHLKARRRHHFSRVDEKRTGSVALWFWESVTST